MKPRAYAVILAGGRGERFWPLSTRRRPKQLLALVGRRALLAQAVDRIRPLVPASRVIVVTSADIRGAVRRLLPAVPAGQVIGEPRGRDTAAAIAAGAALIRARDPGAVFCVLTADQVISREAVFRRTLKELFARAAAGDVLLTIGLKPEFPSTGFGYIEAGARLPGRSAAAMYRVRRFVEKPGRALAARYVKAGRYYWNSGMFVWSLASWTRALERHAPLDAGSTARLRAMLEEGTLTMRGAQRVRALALTLLDLDGGDGPLGVEHVEQALTLRCSARRGVLA